MTSLTNSQVVVIEPHSYTEVSQAIHALWQCKSVVLDLSKMKPEQVQRAVDFIAGATHALQGKQEQVGEDIFIFIPGIYN